MALPDHISTPTGTITGKGFTIDLDSVDWATRSSPSCDNCVMVAFVGDAVLIGDTENPGAEPLIFRRSEWDAFQNGILANPFVAP